MLTDEKKNNALSFVEQKLHDAENRGIYLKVDGHNVDDDWLYIVVTPTREGVRAVDHAQTMAEIEKDMVAEGLETVLLIPAMEGN